MSTLIALGAALMVATALVYWHSPRSTPTRESFLVAGRSIPLGIGAITVTANWLQAPAILLSGVLAYAGPWHFIAFWVPNVLALVVMAFLAPKVQDTAPRGFTTPQLMGVVYGSHVRSVYFGIVLITLTLAVGYTITGLQQWLTPQIRLSLHEMLMIIAAFALIWALPRGIEGIIPGDAVKVGVAALGTVLVIALHTQNGGGFTPIDVTRLDMVSPWFVFWTLGVPLAASLIGGPMCNPDLGERAFALDRKTVRNSYLLAALLFGISVAIFGSLGVLARQLALPVDRSIHLPAFTTLAHTYPSLVLAATVGLVVVFVAALASMLVSAGNLFVNEVYRRFIKPDAPDRETVLVSRLFMLVPVLFGTYVASIPGADLSTILQSLAVVRGEAIVPMVAALFFPKAMSSRAVLLGMLAGAILGISMTYGHFVWLALTGFESPFWRIHGPPLGAVAAVLSPLVALVVERSVRSRTADSPT